MPAILDDLIITLKNSHGDYHDVHIRIFESNIGVKWYNALNNLLKNEQHLEKNYLWHGWVHTCRMILALVPSSFLL